MFFVERALGVKDAVPERLLSPPATGGRKARLTFFFDYSSPWSYLGCCRLDALLRSVSPVEVSVEWVPILLGALFKSIGTLVVSVCVCVCVCVCVWCVTLLLHTGSYDWHESSEGAIHAAGLEGLDVLCRCGATVA